jgi:glutamyl-tRNA synthetase
MIVTRFAPSPTGFLHIGGARTALYNYLYAKHCGGKFILRMEDTDTARSTPEFAQGIMNGLSWLGIHWDNDEVPFQSQRLDRYAFYVAKLRDKGVAYDKEGAVYLKGREEVPDFVIVKSDGMPVFHLAVVVDDIDMGVNVIIRGVDHLTNTDKHKLIYDYLGVKPPDYYHVPLIVDENNQPLSKRRSDTNVEYYRDNDYLPEAVFNFLARLGWGHGNQEVFSQDELIALFDVAKVSKNPAKLDLRKLGWLNIQYIKRATIESLRRFKKPHLQALIDESTADPKLRLCLNELAQKANDIAELDQLCVPFIPYGEIPAVPAEQLQPIVMAVLPDLVARLQRVPTWEKTLIEACFHDFLADHRLAMKDLAPTIRTLCTGTSKSLDLYSLLFYLGLETTIKRLSK